MKAVMMAVVVHLTATGGAGAREEQGSQAAKRNEVSSDADVGKHFSELMKEWKSLKEDFEMEREKARHEAERKKREAEAGNEPQPQRAPTPR